MNAVVATGRALIDRGAAVRDRLGVRQAARVPALRALRLRQQRIDGIDGNGDRQRRRHDDSVDAAILIDRFAFRGK